MKKPLEAVLESASFIDKAGDLMGSKKALAEKIGVPRELLHYWRLNTLLPLDKAIEVYLVTNGEVSIYGLRPDLKTIIKKFVMLFIKKELENKGSWIINFLKQLLKV